MTIALSLASLGHFMEHPLHRARLIQWLDRAPRYVDGFEIHVGSIDELLIWALSLRGGAEALPGALNSLPQRNIAAILQSSFLSIHLPSPPAPEGRERTALAYSMDLLHATLGIQDFTIHPNGTSPTLWNKIMGDVSSPAYLSIENMDPRKESHQTLQEISALLDATPRLRHTFDVCHWMELGNASDDPSLLEFLHRYRDQISKIHFSVPQSSSGLYDMGESTSHCLSIAGGPAIRDGFFTALDPSIPFIVEGYIPVLAALPLLERETRFLRSVKNAWASRNTKAA